MPKKYFWQSDCLSNLAILLFCMAFVFLIVVFFIDHWFKRYLLISLKHRIQDKVQWYIGSDGKRNACMKVISYLSTITVGRVKRICVFEHSVMTNCNCACPAIQRGQGSGFLSEGFSWLTACMSEQQRFWRDCADAQARLNLRCSHRR